MTFTERLIARQEPWLTEDYEILLKALAVMFEPLLEVAEEEGEDGTAGYLPAYGKLLSPALCPGKDLGYLGQFVGVEVPSGASESEARALVKAEAGFARGTLGALERAISRTLASAAPAFPALAASDTFKRAPEEPLSNGAKWTAVGAANTGRVGIAEAWEAYSGAAKAVWNVTKQANPAVAVDLLTATAGGIELYCCLPELNFQNGYKVEHNSGHVTIRRITGGAALAIASVSGVTLANGDSIGIAVRGGIVSGWRKRSGVWSKIIEVSDSTYTEGYAGIAETPTTAPQMTCQNFALGEMPAATEGFTIKEREPTPYSFQVFVAPGGATQALYNAINEVIPAGLWYTISEVEDPWSLGTKKWSAIAAGKKWSELKAGDY